jgi:sugar phosphate isomerase/epimerase
MLPTPAPELIATCWLTAGTTAPLSLDERSPIPFVERVAAARDAGFVGFGLLHADLVTLRDTIGFDGIRDVLDGHGMKYLELEMLVDWFSDGPDRERADVVRRDLLAAAAALGARHIKAGGDFSGSPWPFDRMVTEFRTLAEQAADAGTRIGIEPIAFANIRTPTDALRLVEEANRPAGGMVVDIWHIGRLGIPLESLSDLPADAIVSTELDDADEAVVGSLLEDTINQRRLPGHGVFDVPGFISAIRKTGYRGPWGVEVISHAQRAKPLAQGVTEAYQTTMRQFELADA